MLPVQILLLAFAFFALLRIGMQLRRKVCTRSDAFVWTVVWLGVAVVSLLPNAATWVANSVGVGRGSDLVLYIGALVLFSAVFRAFARLHELEKTLMELVRKQAIEHPKIPDQEERSKSKKVL